VLGFEKRTHLPTLQKSIILTIFKENAIFSKIFKIARPMTIFQYWCFYNMTFRLLCIENVVMKIKYIDKLQEGMNNVFRLV